MITVLLLDLFATRMGFLAFGLQVQAQVSAEVHIFIVFTCMYMYIYIYIYIPQYVYISETDLAPWGSHV